MKVAVFGFILAGALVTSGCGEGPSHSNPNPGQSPSVASQSQAAWETSWESFVEVWNKCLQGCDRQQFVGKEVVWQGVVSRTAEQPSGQLFICLNMDGPKPLDAAGQGGGPGFSLAFCLIPTEAQRAAWRNVTSGQTVRFRTKTAEGYGGLIGFSSAGDTPFAMVNTEGAELLHVSNSPAN